MNQKKSDPRIELARQYVENGFTILVVSPKAKKPFNRWRRGEDGSDLQPPFLVVFNVDDLANGVFL